ncbi:MAG TPA: flagellar biosynthetic protein FliR [Polyangiaceae bacterium]|jgi:type III secretory pathway component EscT|nr:flagellar biosynthetic protein FliR [Polyangiaceae bacterium]
MPDPVARAIGEAVEALARAGIDVAALGLAWARALPAVVLVPAFGLRALPAPSRAVIALAFAACIFPALGPTDLHVPSGLSVVAVVVAALIEVARGLPIAIAAAVPLWAATMVGGVADALRASQEQPTSPAVEGAATPMGVPLSLLASAIFLATGGPARVVTALAFRPAIGHPVLAAAEDLVGGIALAVALGGPLLAAAVVIEIAGALVARAASPAQVHTLIAPLRALATLAITGVVFERLAAALAEHLP